MKRSRYKTGGWFHRSLRSRPRGRLAGLTWLSRPWSNVWRSNSDLLRALWLERRVRRETSWFASNTSSLSIGGGDGVGTLSDPARVVGMHFFNPPTKMRLVEVVRSDATSDGTVAFATEVVKALDKTPVVCVDSPDFVVNRVCRPFYYEAELLVTQGVECARVDAIARAAWGHRMGPLELLDFTGLHTHLSSSETALRGLGESRYRPIPVGAAFWCEVE